MENSKEIKAAIEQADKILLHLHPNPDLDSVGSALGMCWAVKQLGKNSTVIRGDSELPDFVPLFPGHEEILLKNFFEINLADYDLMIIVDSPVERISALSEVRFPPNFPTVLIDHHATSKPVCGVNLIRPEYPANCQLLFDLFTDWGVVLDRNIATCLFLGIYGDTGGFRYAGTTNRTFLAVARLTELVPDFPKLIFTLDNNRFPETIFYEALALNSIEVMFGRVAISAVSYQELVAKGIKPKHLGPVSLSNKLKSVPGWDLGVELSEEEPNQVHISLRTRDPEKFDASKLAVALGGGGHRAAAGAVVMGNIVATKTKLREILPKIYPDLVKNGQN